MKTECWVCEENEKSLMQVGSCKMLLSNSTYLAILLMSLSTTQLCAPLYDFLHCTGPDVSQEGMISPMMAMGGIWFFFFGLVSAKDFCCSAA